MCLVSTPATRKQQIVTNLQGKFKDVESEYKDELNEIKKLQKDMEKGITQDQKKLKGLAEDAKKEALKNIEKRQKSMEGTLEKQRVLAQQALDKKKVGLDKQLQKAEQDAKKAMSKYLDETSEELKERANQRINNGVSQVTKWLKTSNISTP